MRRIYASHIFFPPQLCHVTPSWCPQDRKRPDSVTTSSRETFFYGNKAKEICFSLVSITISRLLSLSASRVMKDGTGALFFRQKTAFLTSCTVGLNLRKSLLEPWVHLKNQLGYTSFTLLHENIAIKLGEWTTEKKSLGKQITCCTWFMPKAQARVLFPHVFFFSASASLHTSVMSTLMFSPWQH